VLVATLVPMPYSLNLKLDTYGVVMRDEKGDVLLSAWGTTKHAASAEEVELIACREGVKLAAGCIGCQDRPSWSRIAWL
jgi:hypothetical protein